MFSSQHSVPMVPFALMKYERLRGESLPISTAERLRSAARDQWIIHTAGFFRESAALLGSADGNHFMGCCWKNSHIMSLADMSRVDTPRDRIRGSFPGQV